MGDDSDDPQNMRVFDACAEVSELADAPPAPKMIIQRWEECHCKDSIREVSMTCSQLYGTLGLAECLETSVTPRRSSHNDLLASLCLLLVIISSASDQ